MTPIVPIGDLLGSRLSSPLTQPGPGPGRKKLAKFLILRETFTLARPYLISIAAPMGPIAMASQSPTSLDHLRVIPKSSSGPKVRPGDSDPGTGRL